MAHLPTGRGSTSPRRSNDLVLHFGLAPIVVESFSGSRQSLVGAIDDLHRRRATPNGFDADGRVVTFQGVRWTFGVLISSYAALNSSWIYARGGNPPPQGTMVIAGGLNHPSWDIGIVQNLTRYRGEFTYGSPRPVVVQLPTGRTLLDGAPNPGGGQTHAPWVWPDGVTGQMGRSYWYAESWTTIHTDRSSGIATFGPSPGGPASIWLYFNDAPQEAVPQRLNGNLITKIRTVYGFKFWVLAIPSPRTGIAPVNEYRRLLMSNAFTAEIWLPNLGFLPNNQSVRFGPIGDFTAGGVHAPARPYHRDLNISVGRGHSGGAAPVVGGQTALQWAIPAFASQGLQI